MKLSNTSYVMFRTNPEKFRLYRLLRLVPTIQPDALGRGKYLHLLAEQYLGGHDAAWLELKVSEELVDFSNESIAGARRLWPALQAWIDSQPGRFTAVELEVDVPLPPSEHFLTTRVDAIYEYDNGYDTNGNPIVSVIVPDWKSGGRLRTVIDIERQWRCDTQAEHLIIGARHATGRNVEGVKIVSVFDTSIEPTIVELSVQRDEYKLEYQMLASRMACEEIEFLIQRFGVNRPWPHFIPSKWSCDDRGSCNNGWCDYASICGQELNGVPEGFVQDTARLQEDGIIRGSGSL